MSEWGFSDLISLERQERLRCAPSFQQIVESIVSEAEVTHVANCLGNIDQEVKGCWRPVFQLHISEKLFDWFFNSERGYRAQYWIGPDTGFCANAIFVATILPKLLLSVRPQFSPSKNVDEIEAALSLSSAKVWIDESGKRAENKTIQFVSELLVEPWVSSARQYDQDRTLISEKPGIEKAIEGILAPSGTTLEVKGAFLDQSGCERISNNKRDRARQIHQYGFS